MLSTTDINIGIELYNNSPTIPNQASCFVCYDDLSSINKYPQKVCNCNTVIHIDCQRKIIEKIPSFSYLECHICKSQYTNIRKVTYSIRLTTNGKFMILYFLCIFSLLCTGIYEIYCSYISREKYILVFQIIGGVFISISCISCIFIVSYNRPVIYFKKIKPKIIYNDNVRSKDFIVGVR